MTRGAVAAAGGTQKAGARTWLSAQRRLRGALWGVWLALVATLAPLPAAQAFVSTATDVPTMARGDLPPQGREVLARIENGDSFSHPKDGSVFGNRERLLPKQTRGYYREYTVPTPGLKHRGTKRIVCGGEPQRRPTACYYTEDHYASFRLIAP
jgi:ribonuclease T1